jgi:hypothetical protein
MVLRVALVVNCLNLLQYVVISRQTLHRRHNRK